MSGRHKQRMSFQDAMDMTPDDLPDGAFFAMAHEIAGLEYGEGFDELISDAEPETFHRVLSRKSFKCKPCGKRFKTQADMDAHLRDTGHVAAKCPVCAKNFKDEVAVQMHSAAKHPTGAT